jgi:two-component sensor histidine kinase
VNSNFKWPNFGEAYTSSQFFAQSPKMIQLEKEVFNYNNKFEYTNSLQAINKQLANPKSTNEDKYFCFLYKSYTFKRIFNYNAALENLDLAEQFAQKTNKEDKYKAILISEKAYCYFDIQKYKTADSFMSLLRANNYRHLDNGNIARLIMQEGYLRFKEKKYTLSEKLYNNAINYMANSTPHDMPMILGKKIELYGSMKQEKLMKETYKLSLKFADSFNIFKYVLYTNECMLHAYENVGDYKQYIIYSKKLDLLRDKYAQKENDKIVSIMDKKYETIKKEKQIQKQNAELAQYKFQIFILILSILVLGLGIIVYYNYSKRKQQKNEVLLQLKFSRKLLQNTEEQKKQMALNIHDSINHELLALKNSVDPKNPKLISDLEKVIDEVRLLSRELYPSMFETLGLKTSLEILCDKTTKAGLFTTCDIDYTSTLKTESELQIYRIAQEALNNTLKHAKADAAKIIVSTAPLGIELIIKDNGTGFHVATKTKDSSSFGLQSIIQRAKAIGGKIQIDSNAKGTIISVILPLAT